jgi:hypothetical protein
LRKEQSETKVDPIKVSEAADMGLFLCEVGARLSDVFGADSILWVEGRTEEVCFRRIVATLLRIELMGTEIIGVRSVGDLQGRQKHVVLEIYQKLCTGKGLLPPALAFCFDREGLTEPDRLELSKNSQDLISFISRKMYENYLLNPAAIAAVLGELDSGRARPVTVQEVQAALAKEQTTVMRTGSLMFMELISLEICSTSFPTAVFPTTNHGMG